MSNKSGVVKSAKVECRMCGTEHAPIREFQAEDGGYICSWRCMAQFIYKALYGYPCPTETLNSIDETAFWRSYHHEMAKQSST
jgi:hypothetical protein